MVLIILILLISLTLYRIFIKLNRVINGTDYTILHSDGPDLPGSETDSKIDTSNQDVLGA